MRLTITLDDDLYAEASKAAGVRDKAALIHAGLRSLIVDAALRRLVALGGAMPDAKAAPRRRPSADAPAVRRKRSGRAA